MPKEFFNYSSFDFDGVGREHQEGEVVITEEKQDCLFGIQENSCCPGYGIYQEKRMENLSNQNWQQQAQPLSSLPDSSSIYCTDDSIFNSFFLPFQPVQETSNYYQNDQPTFCKEEQQPFSSSSLKLLNDYSIELKRLKGENVDDLSKKTNGEDRKLSTEDILRVAGKFYVQNSTTKIDNFSPFSHPYGSSIFGLGLFERDKHDLQLVCDLLSAAEKVSYHQYDQASKILDACQWVDYKMKNPIQRLVSCFVEALHDKINHEIGNKIRPKQYDGKGCHDLNLRWSQDYAHLVCHKELPFSQIMQCAGVQAIIENVGSGNKIHLIDLEIRVGAQWIIMMQALQNRSIELLKITAVGIRNKNKIEETGKRLTSFAKSMNLPFIFKVVFLSDMNELRKELFDVKNDEVVAIYCSYILRTMIPTPTCLENLMRVVRKLNPSIMVVNEIEANQNSPLYVSRFIEALFFYGAFFDCLNTCMNDKNHSSREKIEGVFRHSINYIITREGPERIIRNVKLDVWREFFTRFGMTEIELSESSLYQASLIVNKRESWRSCTLDRNGTSLIVGWKGSPLHSLSTWKFC